jgi:hypothetical protein
VLAAVLGEPQNRAANSHSSHVYSLQCGITRSL